MYSFSKRSKAQLETCHADLQCIANEAIKVSRVDFAVTEGYRDPARQKILFDAGKSRIDGISRKGKHNYKPSKAFDVAAVVAGEMTWELPYLCYIGGVMITTSHKLFKSGDITHILRWGLDWNSNGVFVMHDSAETLIDAPHFEIVAPTPDAF